MISYNYPPVPVIGSIRFAKLAKYLPEHGWLPTVLSVSRDRTNWGSMDPSLGLFPDVKVIRAPFPDIVTVAHDLLVRARLAQPVRLEESEAAVPEPGSKGFLRRIAHKLFEQVRKVFTFPDRYLLWFPFAVALGAWEMHREKYDVICATSPPSTNLLVAAALHHLSGVPWIADFRDPWTQSALHPRTPTELFLEEKLEKKVIRSAESIVAVTEQMASGLEELHGGKPGGSVCITNGYDPEDFKGEAKGWPDLFNLVYTGQVIVGKRDPSVLLEAVAELVKADELDSSAIRISFYGPKEPFLLSLKESFQYPEIIEIKGIVPREESIARQKGATALLIFQWKNPYTTTLHGGKVFEYLGSRRPILASIYKGGALGKLLESTQAGEAAADKGELKDILKRWFDEYKRRGNLEYRGLEEEIQRYSWHNLAGKYSELLDRVCADE